MRKFDSDNDKQSGTKQQIVSQNMQMTNVHGCTWIHYRDGKVVENEALGHVDKDQSTPLTPDIPLGVASLSKPVFAYLVLRLVEAGILDLNEPLADTCVHDCLNGIEQRDAHGSEYLHAVTPLLVLQHREGFPVKIADKLHQFSFEPGKAFSYSGLGFAWLQQVIEEKTGQPLEALAQKYVFKFLGMNHSSYLSPEDRLSNQEKQGRAWNSLYSTANDYAIFANACVSGKGLPENCPAFEFTPQFTMTKDAWAVARDIPKADLDKLAWGLIFGLQKTPEGIKGWHYGDMNGKRGLVVFDINQDEHGDLFVFIADSADEYGFTLLDSVLPPDMEITPIKTYLEKKLGFSLDLKPGWEASQKEQMSEIDQYLDETDNKKCQLSPAENQAEKMIQEQRKIISPNTLAQMQAQTLAQSPSDNHELSEPVIPTSQSHDEKYQYTSPTPFSIENKPKNEKG